MKFAKRTFLLAGIYGLLVLLPQYFLEQKNGIDFPPPINHPEYYYGFVGVAVAWQVLFVILSRDPARYRAMMLPAILEKASFGMAGIVLYLQQRVPAAVLGLGLIDLVWGALFALSYFKTPSDRA
ncbi:MAG: hypothetical protein ACRD9R_22805 [Pyrinomonadaceae bacterium]